MFVTMLQVKLLEYVVDQQIANLMCAWCADQFTWLRGDPTDVPVPGHPTVIELWASW